MEALRRQNDELRALGAAASIPAAVRERGGGRGAEAGRDHDKTRTRGAIENLQLIFGKS